MLDLYLIVVVNVDLAHSNAHTFIQGHLVRGAIKITIESMQKTPNRMRKENEMPEKCERRVNGKINAFRFSL